MMDRNRAQNSPGAHSASQKTSKNSSKRVAPGVGMGSWGVGLGCRPDECLVIPCCCFSPPLLLLLEVVVVVVVVVVVKFVV